VAQSAGGEANAALTFNSTRSPFLMNCSMPPKAAKARLIVFTRSAPVMMLIFGPTCGREKSGSDTRSVTVSAFGPVRSYSQ